MKYGKKKRGSETTERDQDQGPNVLRPQHVKCYLCGREISY